MPAQPQVDDWKQFAMDCGYLLERLDEIHDDRAINFVECTLEGVQRIKRFAEEAQHVTDNMRKMLELFSRRADLWLDGEYDR